MPLTVVSAKRPVRPAPFPLDELHTDPARPEPAASRWRPRRVGTAPSSGSTGACTPTARSRSRRLRKAALNSAARWIIERQENDGCWGGIQPPAVYSLIALRLLGYDLDHPVMRAGLESLDRFAVWREDGARMIEACQSPVWDTCLATIALADAGLPADHPALVKAADWMLGEEIVRPGDWSVRRPQLPPGGWAFEFHNDNYPDIDDTAEVVLALRRVRHPDPERVETAIGRGRALEPRHAVRGTAPGAPSTPTTPARFPNRLPFCDFGEVIDPPSADVTAHVVEMLAAEGSRDDPRTRRGIDWLLAEQEARRRLVRPLGRQLRLRHRVGGPRADRRRAARLAPRDPPGRQLAGDASRTTTAAGARTCAPTTTPRNGAAAAPPPPRRPPGRCSRCWRRGSGSRKAVERGIALARRRPSGRTAPGTSRTSPAPASPGTSPSTTTSTGRSSRSPRSAGTCTASRSPAPAREGGADGPRHRPPRPRC